MRTQRSWMARDWGRWLVRALVRGGPGACSGFTLVEVIVATVIGAAVTGAVVSMTIVGQNLWRRSNNEVYVRDEARRALDHMTRELAEAKITARGVYLCGRYIHFRPVDPAQPYSDTGGIRWADYQVQFVKSLCGALATSDAAWRNGREIRRSVLPDGGTWGSMTVVTRDAHWTDTGMDFRLDDSGAQPALNVTVTVTKCRTEERLCPSAGGAAGGGVEATYTETRRIVLHNPQ